MQSIRAFLSAGRAWTLSAALASASLASAQVHHALVDTGDRTARIQGVVQRSLEHRDSGGPQAGGVCVALSNMGVMFAPGVTADQMFASLAEREEESYDEYMPASSRWTYTATDGYVSIGQPITLTYSFVPDGTMINGAYDYPDAEPSVLFAELDAGFPGGRSAWRSAFAQAMQRWGELTNIQYVEVADDGSTFNTAAPGELAGSGVVGRGDVRIGMRRIGNPLAYNYYPANGGDMVLDSEDLVTLLNPAGNYRNLRNVLMHEHGHGIGLAHVIPQNATKLMEPALNTAFDGPQEDDIRAHYLYGDPQEANDGYPDETFVGGPLGPVDSFGPQRFDLEGVSLERAGAADWYGFTAYADAQIAIRVHPVGTTYDAGPQNGVAETIDAQAARNLALRLWRRVSSQTGQLDLVAQIDFNAAGQDEYHPPIRYTLAGYMLAEVYSNDGSDVSQRYTISISNTTIEEDQEPGDIAVVHGADEITDAETLYFPQTVIGANASVGLVVYNTGAGALHFTGNPTVRVEGPGAADFLVGTLPSSIPAGGFAPLGITFAPQSEGQRVAVVSIPSDDPDEGALSFIVSGAAVRPAQASITVSVAGQELPSDDAFDLGATTAGQDITAALTVRNTGNATLNVSSISFTGSDAARFSSTIANASLSPGASASGTLRYQASDVGLHAAQLRINSNAAQGPFRLDLSAETVADLVDCDGNGVDDTQDLADGAEDCNANGVPDVCEPDADGDGVIDACEVVEDEPADVDSDGDGTADAEDGCPLDAAKTDPSACGCGTSDVDSDFDGLADCDDAFPNDPTNGGGPFDEGGAEGPTDPNTTADVPVDPNGEAFEGQDEDANQDPYDDPVFPAPCGFGMGFASLMGLVSLGGARATRRLDGRR